MPPTGASSAAEWEATYGADVTAILECLESPSQELHEPDSFVALRSAL